MESFDSVAEFLPPSAVLLGLSLLPVERSAGEMLGLDAHAEFLTIGGAPGGIDKLLKMLTKSLSDFDSYLDVRDVVVPISLALNCLRCIAPRFRRLPSVPHRTLSAEQVLLGQDKQFIDLHWMKCSGFRKTVDSKHFESLFLGADFASLADGFVRVNWKISTKIDALKLSENVQWELSSYQSAAHRDKWHYITLFYLLYTISFYGLCFMYFKLIFYV